MPILVVGLHARSAPLELVEASSISGEALEKAALTLASSAHIDGAVVLSTCMRTEVYASAEEFHPALGAVGEFLAGLAQEDPQRLSPYLYCYWDQGAARHLFRVAAGLDSAVVGEGEILGQVRKAWRVSRTARASSAALDALFRAALGAARAVRSKAGPSRASWSTAGLSVELAEAKLGTIEGKRAAVVGSGELARGLVRRLTRNGALVSVVARRGSESASELARARTVSLVDLEALPDALVWADAAFFALGGSAGQFGVEVISKASPLVAVDLGLPRNLDPSARGLPGVVVLDLTDLSELARRRKEEMAAWEERAAEALEEEFAAWSMRHSRPEAMAVLARLRAWADEVRRSEIERYEKRLGVLDERQRKALDALTSSIVSRLFHKPSVLLREEFGSKAGERLAEAVEVLFGLREPTRRTDWRSEVDFELGSGGPLEAASPGD
jgi:glutamyl-tRNA reductase